MQSRPALRLLFGFILLSLAACNLWASFQQPLWEWGGLTTGRDRWWTIAAFLDAYCGFITFYAWVFCKERRAGPRLAWFIAIMGLGNIATAAYVLLQLRRLPPEAPVHTLLTARNA